MFKNKKMLWLIITIIVVCALFFFWLFKFANNYPWKIEVGARPDFFGVTYSKKMAIDLTLDWKQAYLAILDDLGVKQVRLPVYWDDIEQQDGHYDFTDYDYMFNEGAKRNVKFVAVIGYRLPRWPECQAPGWANSLAITDREADTLKMLQTVVERYKDHPEIAYWQVENEPLLNSFGVCPPSDINFLRQEVALVKKLDPSRPILITGSGELRSWKQEGEIGDIFGTTMYRVVWNSFFGYFRYPLPAWFYRFKAYLAGISPDRRWIAELQAEPWAPNSHLKDLPLDEAQKSFNIDQFNANAQFAVNVGFQKAYFWGVEWWYFQKTKNGHPEYWDLARTFFKQ